MKQYADLTDGTGMLSSREIMDFDQRKNFIMKLINIILQPTLKCVGSMCDEKLEMDKLNMIMATFSSVKVDAELYNLTMVDDNDNIRCLEEIYQKHKFYMINASPVFDREKEELLILIEFYKRIETDPMDFLDDMLKLNGPLIGFLYIAQLVGLAQKNYRNKFLLANRAKSWLYEHDKTMSMEARDKASVALAQMAIDYHTNSMIIDNIKEHDQQAVQLSRDFINELKNSSFILYDRKYNYEMTQIDILDKLLEDAEIEFFKSSSRNSGQVSADDA